MELLSTLNQFHFLRPAWLLLLLPAVLLIGFVYLRSDSLRAWKRVISPHLLDHLLMREDVQEGRWRPVYMLGTGWLLGILALAGPSWQMQASPFGEDQSALFIVVKVTPQMLASDIQPSRLQRSVMKINDLLEIKNDIRTGLIAYTGSAHLVMPLTSDAGVINTFAQALEPGIMPRAGDEPAEAIALASQRLKDAGVPGSIILITDTVEESQLAELEAIYKRDAIDVHILAMAAGPGVVPPDGSYPAPALDMVPLRRASRVMGGSVTAVTADARDLENISASVERSISGAPAQDGRQWKDEGYYLLIPLLLILLTFFRRGGAVTVE